MLLRRITQHVKEQNWFAVGIDFAIVVIGVFVGIQVANWNEARSEVQLGEDYLRGFHADLVADAAMLDAEIEARRSQYRAAETVLEFFDGRAMDPDAFFESYYQALYALSTQPNENTLEEVLSSGNLRLIRDAETRAGLLNLYAMYEDIARQEEHLARDTDKYLYDTTFTTTPIQIVGPWEDNEANRAAAERLLRNVAIENGFRLIIVNLVFGDEGIITDLETAREQVRDLLDALSEYD